MTTANERSMARMAPKSFKGSLPMNPKELDILMLSFFNKFQVSHLFKKAPCFDCFESRRSHVRSHFSHHWPPCGREEVEHLTKLLQRLEAAGAAG
jgi:hypothetical protein